MFGGPESRSCDLLDLAWILTALGRADEFLVAAARAAISTRWLEAGTAYARGQMEKAADICAVIGVLPNEAYIRLRAGEKMLDDGRPEAAEPQLRKALEFYRSVHADAYTHEAEALRTACRALDAASGTDDR